MVATSTRATDAAVRAGVAFTTHPYAHDPRTEAYGTEAVAALGFDPQRVFKTLVVQTGERAGVAVVPVGAELDLKACAQQLGAKHATLATPGDAQRLTGYVLGGISPLGQKRRLATVVDETAETFPTVYVSGGRRG